MRENLYQSDTVEYFNLKQLSILKSGVAQLQAYFNKVQPIIARASNGDDVPTGV